MLEQEAFITFHFDELETIDVGPIEKRCFIRGWNQGFNDDGTQKEHIYQDFIY